MKSYHALAPEDLAEYYVSAKGGFLPDTAAGLIEDIKRWLIKSKLDHRVDEATGIAQAVVLIAEEIRGQEPVRQPMPTPEEQAWAENLRQGTTADDAALQYELPPGDPRQSLANFLMR